MGSTLVTEEKLHVVLGNVAPCTLPEDAYGPEPLQWLKTTRCSVGVDFVAAQSR